MVLNHDCEKWRHWAHFSACSLTRLLRGEMHCLNIKRNFSYFLVSPAFLSKNLDKFGLSKVTTKAQMGAGPFLLCWSLISQLFLLVSWLRGCVFCFGSLAFFFFVTCWIFVPGSIVAHKQYCRQRCPTPVYLEVQHRDKTGSGSQYRGEVLCKGGCSNRSWSGLPGRPLACRQMAFLGAEISDAIFLSVKSKCFDCWFPQSSAEL